MDKASYTRELGVRLDLPPVALHRVEPQAASSTVGAKATFRLTGRTVAFVSRLGRTEGKATIHVDANKVASIDP